MSGHQHIVRPMRVAPPSLRPAPEVLTPQVADRLVTLADRLRAIHEDVQREANEAGKLRERAGHYGGGVGSPLPARPAPSPGFAAELTKARLSNSRPPAADREPCVRCGTRGDVGCAHRRPMEARS